MNQFSDECRLAQCGVVGRSARLQSRDRREQINRIVAIARGWSASCPVNVHVSNLLEHHAGDVRDAGLHHEQADSSMTIND